MADPRNSTHQKTNQKIVGLFLVMIWIAVSSMPAWAVAHVPHPHKIQKREFKSPYRPNWVSVIKKGVLFKYKRKEFSSPRIHDNLIFVGGSGSYFYAMQKKNGRKIWRFHADGAINSAPAFLEGQVFFGDDKGTFYALDQKTGKGLWNVPLGAEIVTEPIVAGTKVYVTTLEGRVTALAVEDGRILWDNNFPYEGHGLTILGAATPILDQGHLLVGFADGRLRCLSLQDGHLLWDKQLSQPQAQFTDVDAPPLLDGDRLYVASFEGPVMALSSKKGDVLWRQDQGTGVGLAMSGDVLFVAGSDSTLYALQKRDGKKLWSQHVSTGALTAPVAYKNTVIVGTSEKTVNFYRADTGELIIRRFARKGIFSDLVLNQDKHDFLYFMSNGGRLYSLKLMP